MKISELIKKLQEQQKMYGDEDVKVWDHSSGIRYNVDYVTYWTKEREYQIGIKQDIPKS